MDRLLWTARTSCSYEPACERRSGSDPPARAAAACAGGAGDLLRAQVPRVHRGGGPVDHAQRRGPAGRQRRGFRRVGGGFRQRRVAGRVLRVRGNGTGCPVYQQRGRDLHRPCRRGGSRPPAPGLRHRRRRLRQRRPARLVRDLDLHRRPPPRHFKYRKHALRQSGESPLRGAFRCRAGAGRRLGMGGCSGRRGPRRTPRHRRDQRAPVTGSR